jgi:CheY-like chemotaxis protein/HPt (histidine-containing phosphotransfer) domain-containing protein
MAILLVEDNEVNQKVALHLLKGHDVTAVSNGRDAVEACRERRFDVVLMDIQMPGMNGLEATAAIRQMEKAYRTPIIAMTARTILEDRVSYIEGGMDGYISKPFETKAMFEELARVVGINSIRADDSADRLSGDGQPGREPVGTMVTRVRESVSFDSDQLMRLLDADEEKINGFLAAFAAAFPKELALIRDAHARGDLEQIAEASHALLSAAGNLGFKRIHEALTQLEAAAMKGSEEGIPELLDILDEELSSVAREGLRQR